MNPNAKKGAFVIYRPKTTSNRLEDFLFDRGQWAPSQSYAHTLWDVTNQMTPAEAYRHRLATDGKMIRILQRLEWRWQKAFELWVKCSLLVQSAYRGMLGRRYFNSVKDKLIQEKEQREVKKVALELFDNGDIDGAKESLKKCKVLSSDLYVMKIKINYLQNFMGECKRSCRQCMEMYPKTEDSYYVLSCCLVREKKYQEAYDVMNEMMSTIDVPSPHAYRLNGQICSKLETPPLAEANFSANSAYEAAPEDMDTLLQRACSYAMSQHWEDAERDFTTILYYQPYLTNVLCLRARVYACQRKWDLARADYKQVLEWYPGDETAWYGLGEVDQPYEELPMIDDNLVNDAT